MDLDKIIKEHHTNGRFILDRNIFIKQSRIDEITNQILNAIQGIYRKYHISQNQSELIKIDIKDLTSEKNKRENKKI